LAKEKEKQEEEERKRTQALDERIFQERLGRPTPG